MKVPRLLMALVGIGSVLIASGCGSGQSHSLVAGASVKGYTANGDAYGALTATLDTGNVILPSIQLTVVDPQNPAVSYGTVALKPRLDNLTDLTIDVNLTRVGNVAGGGGLLPNGNTLPIGGLDGTRVLALPVGGSGIRVYVALEASIGENKPNAVAMFGVAIPFSELNGVGQYIGGASLFTQFNFDGGVQGIAGIFTGVSSGQSGIGVFVNASALLNKSSSLVAATPGTEGSALVDAAGSVASYVSSRALSFGDVKPSRRKERALNYELYLLHEDGTQLNVE